MARRINDTQIEANNSVNREAVYAQILSVLDNTGISLNSREIAQAIGSEAHRVSTRMTELVDMGKVFTSEKRRCAITNKSVLTFTTDRTMAVNHTQFVSNCEGRNQVVSNTHISIDTTTGQINLKFKGEDKGTLDLNNEEVKNALNHLYSLVNKQF